MPQTTTDFNRSRVGSVAMAACETCGASTGEILIRRRSSKNAPEYVGPRLLRMEGNHCEFCRFLDLWMRSENIDPQNTGLKYGAMKIVDQEGKLIAFVPFTSAELADAEHPFTLGDGSAYTPEHGVTLHAERADDTHFRLVRAEHRTE